MDNRLKLKDKEFDQFERFIRETPVEIDLVESVMNKYENNRYTKQPESFSPYKKAFQKVMIITASVAMFFSLLVVASFISPTMAATIKQVPGLSSIFKFANDLGLKAADEKGLSTKLHTSVTNDDFTLNVSEVVYDGTRVSIAIERPHKEDEKETLMDRISNYELFINGEPIDSFAPFESNSISRFLNPGIDSDSAIVEFSDLSNQGGSPFPEQFNLTLSTSIKGIEEPLKIDIPIKKVEDYVTLQPNVSREYGNIRLTIKKIKITPITTNITTEIVMTDNSKFTLSPFAMDIGLDIFDDKGNKIKLINGNGWNATDGSNQIMDLRYNPFESVPKTITLKPYLQLYDDKEIGAFQYDENGEPKIQYIPELEVKLDLTHINSNERIKKLLLEKLGT